MFYVFSALLYVHSSIAIILMGKRELVAVLNLFSWCFVVVGRLFLVVPRGCLGFVIVVFSDYTHYFSYRLLLKIYFLSRTESKFMCTYIIVSSSLKPYQNFGPDLIPLGLI